VSTLCRLCFPGDPEKSIRRELARIKADFSHNLFEIKNGVGREFARIDAN
jgi:hypothetical protein